MPGYFIGLMSGTSADAIDAVVLEDGPVPKVVYSLSQPLDTDTRDRIFSLYTPGENEIDAMGQLDIDLGEQFAAAANALLQQCGIDKQAIAAIGSHGQTIRHHPPHNSAARGFTLQIGDPNTIAHLTGIQTVADFRRRDMAAGGQGAPLAPAFHAAIAPENSTCALLNLGGIANITIVANSTAVTGFDTGPANCLMDDWIRHCNNQSHDSDGKWATSGTINNELLERLLQHPFFSKVAPKSTGREDFNLAWLQQQTAGLVLASEDIQATLLALSSRSIADAITGCESSPEVIYCCGGGASNPVLLEQIASDTGLHVTSTVTLGIDPDFVEAAAFAWYAAQTLGGSAVELEAMTGATGSSVLGAIYPG